MFTRRGSPPAPAPWQGRRRPVGDTGGVSSSSASGTPRLGVLLAMAMFVFVIDTSLMNVSISAVVRDLDTTASGVQAAVAIEALVSAAFILIGSKLGDLFGRKRAYVTGLVFYASGAVAMVFAQGLAAIIVFWAFVGGLGAALYLPAMQSLIHGNFDGQGAGQGVRHDRRRRRDRRGRRTADRRAADDAAVVARGLPARSGDHRRRAARDRADPRRALHRRPQRRRRRLDPVRPGHVAAGPGRPGLAGRRRVGRGAAGRRDAVLAGAGALARPPPARGQADAVRPRRCSPSRCSSSGSCRASASRSRWADS